MTTLDVKNQVQLPFRSCLELVLSGIRYRLFRATITVAIIALAVAFLMTMLTESLIARRMAATVSRQTAPRSTLLFWVNQLSTPITDRELMMLLSSSKPDGNRFAEITAWGELDEPETKRLVDIARRQKFYLDYFQGLTAGEKRALFGRARGMDIFPHLIDEEHFALFLRELPNARTPLPNLPEAWTAQAEIDPVDQLKAFLGDWNETQPLRRKIQAGHAERIEKVQTWLGERKINPVLAQADADLKKKLRGWDFYVSDEHLQILRRQGALQRDVNLVFGIMKDQEFQKALARYAEADLDDVTDKLLMDTLSRRSGAEWFVEQYEQSKTARQVPLTAERVMEVIDYYRSQMSLAELEAKVSTAAEETGFLGFTARTSWLILVSLLVCAVGIANAMLMSVTERFREIATMKCLGATNRLIMISFVMESIMQGITGGVIGAVIGFLLGVLRAMMSYGWRSLDSLPGVELLAITAFSLVAGVILSALAAVYPARIAAKLAPMEAMRIE